MRAKELRIVVTFETTTEAMGFEKEAGQLWVEGRLIPLPGEIDAGCGLSFSAPVKEKMRISELAARRKCGKIYELVI